MTLAAMGGSDRAWRWFTSSDYADEVAKAETLSVRFKHTETAQEFGRVFELAVAGLLTEEEKEEEEVRELGSPVPQTCTLTSDETVESLFNAQSGSWSCDTCLVTNGHELTQCIACGTSRQPQTGSASTPFIPLDPPKFPPTSTQPPTSPSSSPPPAAVHVNSPIAGHSVPTFIQIPVSSPLRLHIDPTSPVTSHSHTSPLSTCPPPHLPIDLSSPLATRPPPPPILSPLHLPIDLDLTGKHEAGDTTRAREDGGEEDGGEEGEDPLVVGDLSQLPKTEETQGDDVIVVSEDLPDPALVQKAEDLKLPKSFLDGEEEGEGEGEREEEEEGEGEGERKEEEGEKKEGER